MGLDRDFGMAFAKSQLAAGVTLPCSGKVFVSVRDSDKNSAAKLCYDLTALGFQIVATRGHCTVLGAGGH